MMLSFRTRPVSMSGRFVNGTRCTGSTAGPAASTPAALSASAGTMGFRQLTRQRQKLLESSTVIPSAAAWDVMAAASSSAASICLFMRMSFPWG